MKKKTKKQVYNVTCPFCKTNKIPITVEIGEGSEEQVKSSIDMICPFCDHAVSANIDGKLSGDTEVYRSLFMNQE